MKQLVGLKGVEFTKFEYDKMIIPTGSVIYCDPPYEGTTGYKYGFDHVKFWEWCRQKAREGHEVFISEYKAPDDFICVWEMEVKSSLSANGKIGGSKNSVEKLFKYKWS